MDVLDISDTEEVLDLSLWDVIWGPQLPRHRRRFQKHDHVDVCEALSTCARQSLLVGADATGDVEIYRHVETGDIHAFSKLADSVCFHFATSWRALCTQTVPAAKLFFAAPPSSVFHIDHELRSGPGADDIAARKLRAALGMCSYYRPQTPVYCDEFGYHRPQTPAFCKFDEEEFDDIVPANDDEEDAAELDMLRQI